MFHLPWQCRISTLCRVEILRMETYEDGSSYETETDTRLMLENVHVAMEAVHLDSSR